MPNDATLRESARECAETGKQIGLKIRCSHGLVGSIPTTPTKLINQFLMANYVRTVRFKVGDRVVNKPGMTITGKFTQPTKQPATKHGTVTGVVYKTNSRGAKHPYAEVQWDNSSRSELHAANRLFFEEKKDEMIANEREKIM